MADFVGLDVQGIDALVKKLNNLPPAAQDAAVDEVSDYLLNVLRHYPQQKSVTLRQAYGGFKSDKQRRWFFWALKSGAINVPYRRTQGLARGWKKIGNGAKSILANETPGAAFVQPETDKQQANMMRIIGWKPLETEIKERNDKINQKIDGAVKKAMRKVGLA